MAALADPSDLEYEPQLLCLDLQAWDAWRNAGSSVSGPEDRGSWSRCTLQDFFNQSGQPDPADQLTCFTNLDDFITQMELFSKFALALEKGEKESLFGIIENIDNAGHTGRDLIGGGNVDDGAKTDDGITDEVSEVVGATTIESLSRGTIAPADVKRTSPRMLLKGALKPPIPPPAAAKPLPAKLPPRLPPKLPPKPLVAKLSDYEAMLKPDLIQYCKDRGLKYSGLSKEDLAKQLNDFDGRRDGRGGSRSDGRGGSRSDGHSGGKRHHEPEDS